MFCSVAELNLTWYIVLMDCMFFKSTSEARRLTQVFRMTLVEPTYDTCPMYKSCRRTYIDEVNSLLIYVIKLYKVFSLATKIDLYEQKHIKL